VKDQNARDHLVLDIAVELGGARRTWRERGEGVARRKGMDAGSAADRARGKNLIIVGETDDPLFLGPRE